MHIIGNMPYHLQWPYILVDNEVGEYEFMYDIVNGKIKDEIICDIRNCGFQQFPTLDALFTQLEINIEQGLIGPCNLPFGNLTCNIVINNRQFAILEGQLCWVPATFGKYQLSSVNVLATCDINIARIVAKDNGCQLYHIRRCEPVTPQQAQDNPNVDKFERLQFSAYIREHCANLITHVNS